MSPVIGTAPDRVLGVIIEAPARLNPEAHTSLVEVRGPAVPALRTHRVDLLDGDGTS